MLLLKDILGCFQFLSIINKVDFLSTFLWRAPPLEMRRERREFFPERVDKTAIRNAVYVQEYKGSVNMMRIEVILGGAHIELSPCVKKEERS